MTGKQDHVGALINIYLASSARASSARASSLGLSNVSYSYPENRTAAT